MKKIIFFLFLAIALFSGKANAEQYEKKEIFSSINIYEIKVHTDIDVEIYNVETRAETKVVLCSESGVFEVFDYTFENGLLTIGLIGKLEDDDIVARIYTPSFQKLTIMDTANIDIKTVFPLQGFHLHTEKAGSISFMKRVIIEGSMTIDARGSATLDFSDVIVKGNANITQTFTGNIDMQAMVVDGHFKSNITGASNFKTKILKVNSLTLNSTSTSDFDVETLFVENGTINVSLSSSSDMSIGFGIIKNLDYNYITTSDFATFSAKELQMANVEVSTSGASKVVINATGSLIVNKALGTSKIYYVMNSNMVLDILNPISYRAKVQKL